MSSNRGPASANRADGGGSAAPAKPVDEIANAAAGSRSDRKRAAIIEAGRSAFLDDGFGATSMDRIAALADVSKRTVYNHFESKDALFAAVIRDIYAGLSDGETVALKPDTPPRSALLAFATALLRELERPDRQSLIRLVIAESRRFPQLSSHYFAEGKEPAIDKLVTYLKHQIALGRLAVPDSGLAALQFLGMIKESWFWPQILGLPPLRDGAEAAEQAVTTFMARYGQDGGEQETP